jgi:hypothetical protein
MKTLFRFSVISLGVFALISRVHADVNIYWVTDSYSDWDVKLSGTGTQFTPENVGWSGNIVSPSGLWLFHTENNCGYPSAMPGYVSMHNHAIIQFLGEIPASFQPYPDPQSYLFPGQALYSRSYLDFFLPVVPIGDANLMRDGLLNDLGWRGYGTFTITSIPDVNDTSTWTWEAEYSGNGPSLAPIPEPSTVGLVGLSCFLARIFTKNPRRNESRKP